MYIKVERLKKIVVLRTQLDRKLLYSLVCVCGGRGERLEMLEDMDYYH